MKTNKEFGNIGENIAYDYLKKHNYKILEKNYRTSFGEIDIIALDGDTVVFVEVKTRSSMRYGLPQEAVTNKKQFYIKRVAEDYLKKHDLFGEVPIRFDCIAILGDKTEFDIKHIENIF